MVNFVGKYLFSGNPVTREALIALLGSDGKGVTVIRMSENNVSPVNPKDIPQEFRTAMDAWL